MNSFQEQLKHLRKEQKLTIDSAASKISFTAQTIQMLENHDNLFSLDLPTQSLKNYYRRYGEHLGMSERKIVSMLNRIDYLDYNRLRKGKMKPFDYLNRAVILTLIIILGHTIYMLYQQQKVNALKQSVVTLNAPIISNQSSQVSYNKNTDDNGMVTSQSSMPSATISNTKQSEISKSTSTSTIAEN